MGFGISGFEPLSCIIMGLAGWLVRWMDGKFVPTECAWNVFFSPISSQGAANIQTEVSYVVANANKSTEIEISYRKNDK